MGKGSTFFFAAPFGIRREIDASGITTASLTPRVTSDDVRPVTRILVVEDAEFNVILVKAYLKQSGFEIEVAENGRIGVEKVIANRPHLVLMDLQMPVMGGLEATRAIRDWEAKNHLPPIPILAVTAHATSDGAAKSLEAGCSEHLTKPIKKGALLDAISRHLDRRLGITPPSGVEGSALMFLATVRKRDGRDPGEHCAKRLLDRPASGATVQRKWRRFRVPGNRANRSRG